MQSPKAKNVTLVDRTLDENLPGKECPQTGGVWISGEDYQNWVEQQNSPEIDLEELTHRLREVNVTPSESDTKAALCPQCSRFLSRSRIETQPAFYLERCPQCGGIWCDRGEWEILGQLGVRSQIEVLCSGEWQARLREKQQSDRQRQATIDKLGEELATQVFKLAEALKNHPNGDFGVAYLMRQFDRVD